MDKVIVILKIKDIDEEFELEIPTDITVKEFCKAISEGFKLDESNMSISNYYIRTFNPLAFIKGRDKLKDYGVRNGTTIEIL